MASGEPGGGAPRGDAGSAPPAAPRPLAVCARNSYALQGPETPGRRVWLGRMGIDVV